MQDTVLEETPNLSSHLRSIHLWHAVVKQNDAVHLGLATIDTLEATLNHCKCLGAFEREVACYSALKQHRLEHLDVHHVIIHDQNGWVFVHDHEVAVAYAARLAGPGGLGALGKLRLIRLLALFGVVGDEAFRGERGHFLTCGRLYTLALIIACHVAYVEHDILGAVLSLRPGD